MCEETLAEPGGTWYAGFILREGIELLPDQPLPLQPCNAQTTIAWFNTNAALYMDCSDYLATSTVCTQPKHAQVMSANPLSET